MEKVRWSIYRYQAGLRKSSEARPVNRKTYPGDQMREGNVMQARACKDKTYLWGNAKSSGFSDRSLVGTSSWNDPTCPENLRR